MCKKQGLLHAKMGDWEYTASSTPAKTSAKSKKADEIEGLESNPEAAMPSDSEMLFYSTDYFDQLRKSRKDPTPRN